MTVPGMLSGNFRKSRRKDRTLTARAAIPAAGFFRRFISDAAPGENCSSCNCCNDRWPADQLGSGALEANLIALPLILISSGVRFSPTAGLVNEG